MGDPNYYVGPTPVLPSIDGTRTSRSGTTTRLTFKVPAQTLASAGAIPLAGAMLIRYSPSSRLPNKKAPSKSEKTDGTSSYTIAALSEWSIRSASTSMKDTGLPSSSCTSPPMTNSSGSSSSKKYAATLLTLAGFCGLDAETSPRPGAVAAAASGPRAEIRAAASRSPGPKGSLGSFGAISDWCAALPVFSGSAKVKGTVVIIP